jgi:hypothetical protein
MWGGVYSVLCDFCYARVVLLWHMGGSIMAERDLTAREDRFIGLCLVAAAIIVVFSTSCPIHRLQQ